MCLLGRKQRNTEDSNLDRMPSLGQSISGGLTYMLPFTIVFHLPPTCLPWEAWIVFGKMPCKPGSTLWIGILKNSSGFSWWL